MPNKRNAVGSPSRAMGKKRRTTSRTEGKKVQPEEIAQKKDGAGRGRPAKKTKEVGHVVAEVHEETTDNSSGNESEEDARAFPSLRHEIANNSVHFTPSQESSVHDTVGEHVSFKIKEKIWEGKFIELHSLLRTQKEMEELKSGNDDILHYLDDFLFVESSQTSKVGNTLKLFQEVCNNIGIHLASDKTTLPTTLLMFLGIDIDTQNLIMRLPNEKLVKLSQKIRDTLDSSKITLKDMQSLLGLLNFTCKVVAPGRTFCRRLINSTIGVRKSYYKIRVNKQMKADLEVWLDFLKQYNGVTVITDNVWVSNEKIVLFTDSAGGSKGGYGSILQGLLGGTISSYISGVSYHHKIQGIQDTTKFFIIGKALEGIKRIQGGKRNDIRAPITVQLLSDMISCLDKVCKNKYEAALFSAVFSVAFFVLVRVGEITTSKSKSVINGSNLTISDILVRKKVLELRVRWSKTDQKGKSVTLLIPENGNNYCPVRLINEYLKERPTCNNTYLFIHYTGMPLTRYQFSSILEKALHILHISKGHFRSHSFRIGGATELAR
ncbi:unnamed protein product [Mytilus edulis]|uniref:Tyr recombinase domain-containing protein n=1 Tax=Mytilus edulis TaxID=6550 RepID=A0A8S3RER7_MYTED|nr:unnamed protein product [Mytilus edulis]